MPIKQLDMTINSKCNAINYILFNRILNKFGVTNGLKCILSGDYVLSSLL